MIKNKLNVFLMAMVIITLIGLISVSIYFQISIKKVNEKYNQKSAQLEITKQELQSQMNELSNLNTTFVDLNQDLESYTNEFEQVYSMCNQEKDALIVELEEAKKENEEKNALLGELKTSVDSLKSEVTKSQAESDNIISRLHFIESTSDEIIDDIKRKNDDNLTISQCKSFLRTLDDDIEDLKGSALDAEETTGTLNGYLNQIYQAIIDITVPLRRY
jgi:DNA repair exonuclease SbcCD ATPase subunit